MQTLRTILAVALLGAATNSLMTGFALAQDCACPTTTEAGGATHARIIADEPPPPLPDYEQPPMPAPGHIWTPGYWAWNNDDYYWVPGTWVAPPRAGLLFTPGYWAFVDGVYAFHRGYWGPHVGFYGGVSYGHGYFGSGFQGGRWDGDRFFYNRTVNNFGSVKIVNVYEQPAPRILVRASFNGGPDGVRATATADELAAAKETHVQPTVEQRRNASAASRNEAAFVSTNNGKPSVAATSKPGVFVGEAVAPAKAAGGPIKQRRLEAPGNGETVNPVLKTATPEPKADKAERNDMAPKGDKAERKDMAPKGDKADRKDMSPNGDKAERNDMAPKGDKAERKDMAPKGDKADRKDMAPKGGKSERKDMAPKGDKADRKSMAPKGDKADNKADKPKAENAARKDDKPRTEKARSKTDKPNAG